MTDQGIVGVPKNPKDCETKFKKRFLFFPHFIVLTQKRTITHCCCRWFMTGTIRWEIILHSTQWGDTAIFVYAPLAWLSLDKGKKKNTATWIPNSCSVRMPLLLNCEKYLHLNTDYWPPVSNVYWKSVARLPLNIRLQGFAAGLPPSQKGKKLIYCMEIKRSQ